MNIFKQYSEIENQIKKLEEKKELLKPLIIDEVKKLDRALKTIYGTFNVSVTRVWKYTSIVESKKKELAELQKTEQEKGLAKKEEKAKLVFSANKPK